MQTAGEGRRRDGASAWWLAVALVIATAIVYAPLRHAAYLNYDDDRYVSDNSHVNSGFSREGIVWAWTSNQVGNWHPFTMLSHMLDCQLFGLNAGAHHLSSAVFHILNTLLLFAFLAGATGARGRSACVAALFALHPLHVESVAWIAERKDVLSTFFWMLTLLAYLHYVRRPRAQRYVWVVLACTAALLSKAMAVTLPFTLLLLDLWPLRRLAWGGLAERTETSPLRPSLPWTSLVVEKLPLLVLVGICSAVNMRFQEQAGAMVPAAWSPLAYRAANAVRSCGVYLLQTLWPADLTIGYPFEVPLPAWEVPAAAAAIAAVTLLALWGVRRRPYLLVGWLWYLGTLVPVSGLVRVGNQSRADRFTYVPLIGIFIMVVWGLPDLLRSWRHGWVACTAAAVGALVFCSVVSARQVLFWHDSLTFWEHALALTPDNEVAQLNLAAALTQAGRPQEAAAHLAAGRRLDLKVAQQNLLAQLRAQPESANLHLGLGRVLIQLGDTDEGIAHYREASRLEPGSAAIHNNLAVVLEKAGKFDEAIVQYEQGIQLEPDSAESRCNLAAALATAGRVPEAIVQFRAALELRPQLAEGRFGLAMAYAQDGQELAAITELDQLMRERPDWTSVEVTLAWILATARAPAARDARRAVQLAEDATQRTQRRDADALSSLAAAYAAVGRFDDAAAAAQGALELAQLAGRAALASTLGQRLTLYRAGAVPDQGAGDAQPAASVSSAPQLDSTAPDAGTPLQ